MDFKDLQKAVIKNALTYGKNYNITIDEEFALLKLYEEVGELAQAILIHRKKSRPSKHVEPKISKQMVAEEIADVIGMSMVIADLMDIDLETAIDKKWVNKEK